MSRISFKLKPTTSLALSMGITLLSLTNIIKASSPVGIIWIFTMIIGCFFIAYDLKNLAKETRG